MSASGMYEYAIVLPEEDKDAQNIIKLITVLAISVSVLTGIVFYTVSWFIDLDFFIFYYHSLYFLRFVITSFPIGIIG